MKDFPDISRLEKVYSSVDFDNFVELAISRQVAVELAASRSAALRRKRPAPPFVKRLKLRARLLAARAMQARLSLGGV